MYLVMPLFFGLVIAYGMYKRVKVFDVFVDGAKEGLKTMAQIAPTIISLVVAVSLLKASGALDFVSELLKPLCDKVGFPSELITLGILRPVSGSGSTAILNQALNDFTPDSFLGRCASVIAGSTETTFYVVTLYFGYVKIKKIRHTLVCALIADFVAVIMAVVTVCWFF